MPDVGSVVVTLQLDTKQFQSGIRKIRRATSAYWVLRVMAVLTLINIGLFIVDLLR